MFQGWIWTQLRNGDTPFVLAFVKTRDAVPSSVNAVHFTVLVETHWCHHLLLFDSASDVVNEENEKSEDEPALILISVVSKTSKKNGHTEAPQDPRTRREGAQGSFP